MPLTMSLRAASHAAGVYGPWWQSKRPRKTCAQQLAKSTRCCSARDAGLGSGGCWPPERLSSGSAASSRIAVSSGARASVNEPNAGARLSLRNILTRARRTIPQASPAGSASAAWMGRDMSLAFSAQSMSSATRNNQAASPNSFPSVSWMAFRKSLRGSSCPSSSGGAPESRGGARGSAARRSARSNALRSTIWRYSGDITLLLLTVFVLMPGATPASAGSSLSLWLAADIVGAR
mmetsp:Transcript_40136/g.132837  ORF Transcript_40136/g.132837 Transcript_40136/m.132837 type:complete len:235 (-) Transcript_40136:273-977(-)